MTGRDAFAVCGPRLVFIVDLKLTVAKSSISKSLRNGKVELLAFAMVGSFPGQSLDAMRVAMKWFDRNVWIRNFAIL